MNTRTLILAALLTAGASTAFADDDRPQPDWIPLDQAYRALTDAGYRDVFSLKADDGRWEAKAVKDGADLKLLVDPRSGAVTVKPRKAKRGEDR